MPQQSMREVLRGAIEQLSPPFKTPDDVRGTAVTLDAIAGKLLRSQGIVTKIGANRTSELMEKSPDIGYVLGQLPGKAFEQAAACAKDLLAFSRSSLIEFGAEGEDVREANVARERLRDAFASLLDVVDN